MLFAGSAHWPSARRSRPPKPEPLSVTRFFARKVASMVNFQVQVKQARTAPWNSCDSTISTCRQLRFTPGALTVTWKDPALCNVELHFDARRKASKNSRSANSLVYLAACRWFRETRNTFSLSNLSCERFALPSLALVRAELNAVTQEPRDAQVLSKCAPIEAS
jgi:hypothetical protein